MDKKNILIFAHYYHPDIASTGQLLKDMAEGMTEKFNVTVICAVPSYSGTISEKYSTQKYYFEELNGVKIIRVKVPPFTKANKLSRVKNIVAYYFNALGACRRAGSQDYIFALSQPPILGGMLGVAAKRMKRAKLIYCIQDFNPEQIIAVKYVGIPAVLKAAMALDKRSCRKSDLVVTVGRDLVETLERRFSGSKVPRHIMINNWIEEKKIYPLSFEDGRVNAFREQYGLKDKFVIMYSGNMGLYYDLEGLIKVMERFSAENLKTPDGREVIFAMVGDGTICNQLKEYATEHEIKNMVFAPYQAKQDIIYSLNAADVHWCVSAKGIKGVSCPSKAYGIMAVAKPAIGVLEEGSEIRGIIEDSGCGKCCEPGDYDAVSDILKWYITNAGTGELERMGEAGRKYLEEKLSEQASVNKYIDAIESL